MRPSPSRLLLAAVPPVAASLVVLVIGGVGRGIWLSHLAAVVAACALTLAGAGLARVTRVPVPPPALILLTLAGVAVPLLRGADGPNRWAVVGPLNLYMAPVVLPSFFAACAVYARSRGGRDWTTMAAALGVSLLLAAQPDASQVLALLTASTVVFVRGGADRLRSTVTLGAMALVTLWAFSRPDPLLPVPHVEGVFVLALGHSWFAGSVVIVSAVALVALLYAGSRKGPSWLAAVATYYGVLFACSIAGLTPAPLVGFGAGPLLGFGLMAAVSPWLSAVRLSALGR
jgi:hypothetical protein